MINVLVTGHMGFIANYVIKELLNSVVGYNVVGIDDGSKHGYDQRKFDESVKSYPGDVRDSGIMRDIIRKHSINVIIANAALIGGIKYFHNIPYDIIARNNAIIASTIDAAIKGDVNQIIYMSSSMVYESAFWFPSKEGDELAISPPKSTYGFQKLQSEYMLRGALDQYGLKYTIIRPFNAAGIGEESRPSEPGFSHVIPDFIYKSRNDKVVEIFGDGSQVRSFTSVKDIARGVVSCILNDSAINNDFNLVTHEPLTMIELAKKIWSMVRTDKFDFKFVPSFIYDVKRREGTNLKAHRVLGWEPQYTLNDILKEMIVHYE